MSSHRVRVSAGGAVVRDGAVLLVAFEDASGFHYNFPGGGLEADETLREAVRREMREEACAEVEVGPLIGVWENIPARHHGKYGETHTLGMLFRCHLLPSSEPKMPDPPDENQTGVHWVPLNDLQNAPLLPKPDAELVAMLRDGAGVPSIIIE